MADKSPGCTFGHFPQYSQRYEAVKKLTPRQIAVENHPSFLGNSIVGSAKIPRFSIISQLRSAGCTGVGVLFRGRASATSWLHSPRLTRHLRIAEISLVWQTQSGIVPRCLTGPDAACGYTGRKRVFLRPQRNQSGLPCASGVPGDYRRRANNRRIRWSL